MLKTMNLMSRTSSSHAVEQRRSMLKPSRQEHGDAGVAAALDGLTRLSQGETPCWGNSDAKGDTKPTSAPKPKLQRCPRKMTEDWSPCPDSMHQEKKPWFCHACQTPMNVWILNRTFILSNSILPMMKDPSQMNASHVIVSLPLLVPLPFLLSNDVSQSSLLPQDESRVPCHFAWKSHFSSIVCHLRARTHAHIFCFLQIRFLAEPSVFSPNHSMLGSHLKCSLVANLNSQSKESKLSSTNSDSVFIACSALIAASTISFGRCVYERFSTSFNDAQNAQFNTFRNG
jgi:hypothetical protein